MEKGVRCEKSDNAAYVQIEKFYDFLHRDVVLLYYNTQIQPKDPIKQLLTRFRDRSGWK